MRNSNCIDIVDSACDSRKRTTGIQRAFTLLELLVVVSVIALLITIALPGQRRARMQAKIVKVRADLRQVCIALDSYALSNQDRFPPSRSGCGNNVNDQLPVELADAGYLPPSKSRIPQAELMDVFDPVNTYKYRAPGAIYYNGTLYDNPDSSWRPRAQLWVPDDFPNCRDSEGAFYANRTSEKPSPVSYAVWSIGPKKDSKKFPRFEGYEGQSIDTAKFPLPAEFWLKGSGDSGLIANFRDRKGIVHSSL